MVTQEKFGKLCKSKMVDEVGAHFVKHPNFVVTSYMGVSVSDLEKVRRNLKAVSSEYVVVKNSLFRVICDQNKFNDIKPLIDGGIGISFSGEDIASTCKILDTFSKVNDKFKIKCAMVDGKFMTTSQVKTIASLPSKEVLLAQVLAGMMAPITGFVCTLSGVLRKFVYAVDAIKKQKESPAEAPKA